MVQSRSDFLIKRYCVAVVGFPDVYFYASSPGKARSKAWESYLHADDRCSFKRFMQISRVTRCRRVPDGFGDEIMVGDERAYRIGFNGQYVQFVRPCCDVILNSHPLDVKEIENA
ncbi:hypothetical protein FDH38_gp008 [Dinoroseobacter phage vB_DshS-R5C]|uniref:Uncharacterized protein n=1 Tax=Dinoroseobacter phage vB_DshS-R5C TaxID=1965368 RepID=A0A1V0DY28_9CAUD|nr:hypothetical protein FDH38_gp008 [Dinoroseobacter phage vB_DshS-R5C]ARB06062.1 hypothetical protein vBDshSR5C_8 [Dinoroseobacter phage vB_DshS-R5C]